MPTASERVNSDRTAPADVHADLSRPLRRVRAAARRLLVVRETAWVIATVCLAILALGLIDYLLRMPWTLRLGFWAIGLGALGIEVRNRLWPAWRFNPPLSEVALRVERTAAAHAAGLQGVLAAGLELSADRSPGANAGLLEEVVASARAGLRTISPVRASLVRAPARRALLLAAVTVAPLGAITAWKPELAAIGLRRVITPWTVASWPKRTAIADATDLRAHPIGAALPLKAVVLRTDRALGRTDVWAMYRLVDADADRTVRRALLTGQGRGASIPAHPDQHGELYERLVEPAGLITDGEPRDAGNIRTLEYWFETEDDRTDPVRVALVHPPVIEHASAEVTLPAYAAQGEFLSGRRDLGNGRDERASAGPVLVGSHVTLRLTLNKPLTPPEPGAAFAGAPLPDDASLRSEGSDWLLTWTAREPIRLPVMLVDDYGIRTDRDAAFQFGVIADRPPGAAVVEPASDESVLATAVISAKGEGRDDVGIEWTSLDLQLASAPADSAGAPAEATGTVESLVRAEAEGAEREIVVATEIDLSTRSLKPRDEVWLSALAKDTFVGAGESHEAVRSSVRRLRIIAESELIEQVRAELAGVRQAALRLDQDQGDVARRAEFADPEDLRPLQAGVSQRMAPQGDVLKRLVQRIARNNLVDRSLTGLLEDTSGALDRAHAASQEAERDLDRADRAEGEARAGALNEAGAAQRQVRDQLGRLIAMLDRGQDGYTVKREVQRLIDEQRRLIDETRRLGEQSRGQQATELSQTQRDALSQAAAQQQDLARRAAQTLSDMAQKSVDLQRVDPALAQAMDKSAQRGRQDQVPDKQREAAEQIRKNQTGSANQNQEDALQSLQQMMEELEQTERQRDEALKRILEDAIQSIQALVRAQESELATLGRALGASSLAGLDAGMIRLNADTIGVADKVRSSFREMAGVADIIESAAHAQGAAITILRSEAPDGVEAEKAERLSLERLRAALDEAERLRREADEKDVSRKREELRKAYAQTLESQVALHENTRPLVGAALDRRARAGVRGLGEQQIQIRARLTTLRDENPGLSDARLFEFAHERLDRATERAGATLASGEVTDGVDRDQRTAIRVLQSLVEALKDNKKNGEFRDSPDSGGGGQGGQGGQNGEQPLVPSLAELRLLRLMQVEVAELTRDAADAKSGGRLDDRTLPDLGRMQKELADRAVELFSGERPAPNETRDQGPTVNFGAPPRDPPANEHAQSTRSQAPQEAEPPKSDPLPSLDDLLGLPRQQGEPKDSDAEKPAGDAAREELERELTPGQAAGAQSELLSLLRQASERLGTQLDPGTITQRAQAEAIRRIEQLIDAQERNQRQQQSRSRSRQQQQQQQQQQASQRSQSQSPANGDNRQMVDPPARQDGPLSPPAPGAGAQWGSLPQHVRDALQQGKTDRYSALYRALTEEYYRRLAEEPKPAGGPR